VSHIAPYVSHNSRFAGDRPAGGWVRMRL